MRSEPEGRDEKKHIAEDGGEQAGAHGRAFTAKDATYFSSPRSQPPRSGNAP